MEHSTSIHSVHFMSHPSTEPFAVKVSEDFERFLELLGDKIELKGWQKYRGGLDVKSRSYKFRRFPFSFRSLLKQATRAKDHMKVFIS